MTFESDAANLMINDGASACITNNLADFVGKTHHINQQIKSIAGHAQATHKGTVRWKIKDNTGKVHFDLHQGYLLNGQCPN